MLNLLGQYSRGRTAWFLLMLSVLTFEAVALYFQHQLNLAPCTLCIYQRCALFGIFLFALIAFIRPNNFIFRSVAILGWIYSAYEGFNLAYQQARLQFAPSLTDTCSLFVQFPSWLPLDSWFPSLFSAYGSCAEKLWSFLTIEMSQWMIIIFSCYFIVGILVLISQLFSSNKRKTFM